MIKYFSLERLHQNPTKNEWHLTKRLTSAQEEVETAIINVNLTKLSEHMDHPVVVMREIQNRREQLTDWRIFRMVLQWARSSARRRA